MAKAKKTPLNITGRLKSAGITLYEKDGKLIVRSAHSRQPRRMTRKQFITRQRMTHNNALWRALDQTSKTFFEGGSSPCHRFRAVNQECPAVYLTKQMRLNYCSLLLPNMYVSDGPLKPICYQLGEVDNPDTTLGAPATLPALLTDLTTKDFNKGELLLYVLHQTVTNMPFDETPRLKINVKPLTKGDFTLVPSTLLMPFQSKSGTFALIAPYFADPMLGFAIVQIQDGLASTQQIVTNCTYYEHFTTEEALFAAAKSYGGLTEKDEFLRP